MQGTWSSHKVFLKYRFNSQIKKALIKNQNPKRLLFSSPKQLFASRVLEGKGGFPVDNEEFRPTRRSSDRLKHLHYWFYSLKYVSLSLSLFLLLALTKSFPSTHLIIRSGLKFDLLPFHYLNINIELFVVGLW